MMFVGECGIVGSTRTESPMQNPFFGLTATASSGLPVSYSSSDTSVATISGATVTIGSANLVGSP